MPIAGVKLPRRVAMTKKDPPTLLSYPILKAEREDGRIH